MKIPRIGFCFFWALVGFFIAPYASNLLPGGGEEAQRWLDSEIAYIERRIPDCDNTRMREVFQFTVDNYRRVGPFGVRVMQLPNYIHGYNTPFCPGITIDEEVPYMSRKYGAKVLIHEAMHDFPPYFGHFHIDDEQILEYL